MSDDTRMALGIPRVVTTALGAVEVRTLSAVELMMQIEEVLNLWKDMAAETRKEGDSFGAIQRTIFQDPRKVIGIFSRATKRSPDELGSLPLDEFLDVVLAFWDQHEKGIERFFALKGRMEGLAAKSRPSRNSSTVSSPPAGRMPTSEHSASSNSSAMGDSPPFAQSTSESSN